MSATLRPTDGVRILLELERADEGGATYRATIFSPEGETRYTAASDPKGAISLAPVVADPAAPAGELSAPPAGSEELLRRIARTIARKAIADEDADHPPSWPRRVLRWRRLAARSP